LIFDRIGRIKCNQSLNKQRENMTMLFVERNRLAFDHRYDLTGLRKMRTSINVMGILDQMGCDLAAMLKVYLRFTCTCWWN